MVHEERTSDNIICVLSLSSGEKKGSASSWLLRLLLLLLRWLLLRLVSLGTDVCKVVKVPTFEACSHRSNLSLVWSGILGYNSLVLVGHRWFVAMLRKMPISIAISALVARDVGRIMVLALATLGLSPSVTLAWRFSIGCIRHIL
ncbi:hypothetical protein HanRHA438_Chr16g0748041 [Helianthus annuus]|nr:hypothetical protein HanRHA438_Chr16g0748041 [Helianthus annuus]